LTFVSISIEIEERIIMTSHSASTADLSVPSLFNFKNHVVLVTGGATGLGEMAAQGFIQNGARVFIASRKESELKKVS
jgi:NADPH:quinone reductase-like Zn-dependent oxidoreductase